MGSGHRALAVLAALSLTSAVAGCGDDSAGSAPAVAPVVSAGSAGVAPFAEPTCDPPRTAADRDAPGVSRAAAQLRDLGERRFAARYAGLVPCAPEERIVVYRLAAEPDEFKRAAKTIARKHRVDVDFADALFTRKQALATREAVLNSFGELNLAGAPFAYARSHENGTVEVGVRADVPAAERVLADLLDRVFVVLAPSVAPSG